MRLVAVRAEYAGSPALGRVIEPRHRHNATQPTQEKNNAMSENPSPGRSPEKWARFRFSVVGPLLAAPPQPGELQVRLQELSSQKWRQPLTGQWIQYGASTIERWYYTALREKQDPVAALRRKIRSDSGQHPVLGPELREQLLLQFRAHPNWSYQLHADNLAVLAAC